jgi:hypothetical protein
MFSLSFSEEFFFAEGEPYNRSDLALNSNGMPTSVWSALEKMRLEQPDRWVDFTQETGVSTTEGAIDLVRKTDTCKNLNSPVVVWIDAEGEFTIEVYE